MVSYIEITTILVSRLFPSPYFSWQVLKMKSLFVNLSEDYYVILFYLII